MDTNGVNSYVNASDTDRFFRITVAHVTIREQGLEPRITRLLNLKQCGKAVCVNQEISKNIPLTGSFMSDRYQYVEVNILSCLDGNYFPNNECASREEIDATIRKRAKIVLSLSVQDFDTPQYKLQHNNGVIGKQTHDRYYLIPEITLKNEVYLRGRQISHEKEHFGSPPFPEKVTNILDVDTIDSRQAPRREGDNYATFYIRLSETISLEETQYWMPSLLDLFGMWGALFTFISTLSVGLAAKIYNSWKCYESFRRHLRCKSSHLCKSSHFSEGFEGWANTIYSLHEVAQNARDIHLEEGIIHPQNHHDLDVDIRLFDKNHFDRNGRLVVSAEEFAMPTTIYGELRAFAIKEHVAKKKAAGLLSKWMRRRSIARNSQKNASHKIGEWKEN